MPISKQVRRWQSMGRKLLELWQSRVDSQADWGVVYLEETRLKERLIVIPEVPISTQKTTDKPLTWIKYRYEREGTVLPISMRPKLPKTNHPPEEQ